MDDYIKGNISKLKGERESQRNKEIFLLFLVCCLGPGGWVWGEGGPCLVNDVSEVFHICV